MINQTIEQALAPSRASWKDNIYQSKAFAFLTSSALAWTLLLIALAVSYVLLKMPSLAPQTEVTTMTIYQKDTEKTKPLVKENQKNLTRPNAKESAPTPEKQSEKAAEKSKPVVKDLSPVDTAPMPPSPPFPPN